MPTTSTGPDPDSLAAKAQRAVNASVLAVYEGLADDYERHQLEDCAYQTPAAVAREVAQHTEGPVEVIDVGAGTGLVGEALLRAGVDARVAGVDLVEPMLREIDSPAYRQCVVADAARELPIRSDCFDAAVSVGLMEHVVEPQRFVPEMLRVVKPGGIAVLTYVPNRKGKADIVDPKAGLLSHDTRHIEMIVDGLPGEIVERRAFDAYRNGGHWIQHESVTIVRAQACG